MSKSTTKAALEHLERFGKESGVRITPPRRLVLEIIAGTSKPLTAYEVLDALKNKMDNPKPPTAYRALEFLSEHGFIHRIESLNAYVSCSAGHNHAGSQFMICSNCGRVEEAHLCHVPDALKKQMAGKDFKLDYWNAELHGLCKKCA